MRIRFWLIVGEDESVRVRKGTPLRGSLSETEVAIPLTLEIPSLWFSNRGDVITIAIPEPVRPSIGVEAGQPVEGMDTCPQCGTITVGSGTPLAYECPNCGCAWTDVEAQP